MSLNVPASAFEEQWAFKTIGIPPTDDNSTEQRVVVALFNSAPYKDFDGIKKFYLPDGTPINIEDSIRKFSKNNPTPSSTPTPIAKTLILLIMGFLRQVLYIKLRQMLRSTCSVFSTTMDALTWVWLE